jgi:hypothetical protein
VSGPGLTGEVLRLARAGRAPRSIAVELDLPADLVTVILDHAERAGLAERVCAGCALVPEPGRRLPLACAGCPLGRSLPRAHGRTWDARGG